MAEFNFNGIIIEMKQEGKGNKQDPNPHTMIKIHTKLIPQDAFNKIFEGVCNGHFVSLGIQTLEKKKWILKDYSAYFLIIGIVSVVGAEDIQFV